MEKSIHTCLVVFCLGLFAVLFHDPQSSISDDIRHTTVMEQFYRHGKLHLKDAGTPGINEMHGHDGKIYSASNLGPSLWYYPVFLMGKAFNGIATLPIELRPRCNYIGNIDGDDFSENRQGDWAPIFARLANALLFPLSFLLLVQIAPLSAWGEKYYRFYPWAVLFGTQFLLLNHSNFDHNLNGFGLVLAVAAAAVAYRKGWQKRWLLMAGFGLALSITTRQFSIVYAPIFTAWFTWHLWRVSRLRLLIIVLLPVMVGVGINLAYNVLRSGSCFTTGYDPKWIQFQSPLAGLELYGWSGSQSILLYSPVLALGLIGVLTANWKSKINSFAALLLVISLVHLGFYLVWGYPGGDLVPLRFISEIIFIGIFFVPVAKFRVIRLAAVPLCAWGFVSSVFLSFLDFRRLPVAPPSLATWKTPRDLSGQIAFAEDTYRLLHDMSFTLRTGTPDWLAFLLGGKAALILGSLGLAVLGSVIIFRAGRRAWVFSLPAVCPAIALGLGALLACPGYGPSNCNLSAPTSEIQDMHLVERHGFLVFSGKLAVRDSKIKVYCLRLRHKKYDFVQTKYCKPFTFGAEYYKSNALPVSKSRNGLAEFREFIALEPTLPPGEYEATVEVDGASATLNCTLPDYTPLVRQAGFLDFTHWVRSDNMDSATLFPKLEKNCTSFMAFHLPFEATSSCKGTVFISDSANCEFLSNITGISIIEKEGDRLQFQFSCPKDGTPVILAVKANSTSATLTGIYLEPVK